LQIGFRKDALTGKQNNWNATTSYCPKGRKLEKR
jgi:hypothetical protein